MTYTLETTAQVSYSFNEGGFGVGFFGLGLFGLGSAGKSIPTHTIESSVSVTYTRE